MSKVSVNVDKTEVVTLLIDYSTTKSVLDVPHRRSAAKRLKIVLKRFLPVLEPNNAFRTSLKQFTFRGAVLQVYSISRGEQSSANSSLSSLLFTTIFKMALKFSREDEQILALNFENLCDTDYLHRLFQSDASNSAKEENSLSSAESHLKSALSVSNHIESPMHLSSVELPEDIVLFSGNLSLGHLLFERRQRKEFSAYLRVQDGLSLQTGRQALVYAYMTDIMQRRYQHQLEHQLELRKRKDSLKKAKTSNSQSASRSTSIGMVLDGLLSLLHPEDEEELLSTQHIRSILDILLRFLQSSNVPNHASSSTTVHIHQLRRVVSRQLSAVYDGRFLRSYHMQSGDFDAVSGRFRWEKKAFRESVSSVMQAIYCSVTLALLTKEVGDVIVAIDALLYCLAHIESTSEALMRRAREMKTQPFVSTQQPAPVSSSVPLLIDNSQQTHLKAPATAVLPTGSSSGTGKKGNKKPSKQPQQPSDDGYSTTTADTAIATSADPSSSNNKNNNSSDSVSTLQQASDPPPSSNGPLLKSTGSYHKLTKPSKHARTATTTSMMSTMMMAGDKGVNSPVDALDSPLTMQPAPSNNNNNNNNNNDSKGNNSNASAGNNNNNSGSEPANASVVTAPNAPLTKADKAYRMSQKALLAPGAASSSSSAMPTAALTQDPGSAPSQHAAGLLPQPMTAAVTATAPMMSPRSLVRRVDKELQDASKEATQVCDRSHVFYVVYV